MVSINILKKGDEVISITDRLVSVKRKNGCVDIYNLYSNDKGEVYVDPVVAATICYGEGSIEKQLNDGQTTIVNF